MNFERFVLQMADDAERIRALVHGISDHQAHWKSDADSWSIVEAINHLYDEEREDFRVRLDYILHRPGEIPSAIDPQGWVTARQYNRRDLAQSLSDFLSEREESLRWLRELLSPDWEATYEAPFGPIRAGDMFASWAAHDLLHMRQLVELQWGYTIESVKPYMTNYAGDW